MKSETKMSIFSVKSDTVLQLHYQLRKLILEQKKAVSKMSKLCLGALTSVDQMETKLNEHQPMEKFKRLSEDSVKLNSQVQQSLHDMHLKMERLGNTRVSFCNFGFKLLMSFFPLDLERDFEQGKTSESRLASRDRISMQNIACGQLCNPETLL